MKTQKQKSEKQLRREFVRESRAIFSEMIDELEITRKPHYLWERTAIKILKAWRAQKIALGVDSTLPDHYKIDPPVFIDGWIEKGEQVHRGAGHFSLFATLYDDEEAERAWEIIMRTTKRGFNARRGRNATGRRGGLDMPHCWACHEMYWAIQVERDLEKREADTIKKEF